MTTYKYPFVFPIEDSGNIDDRKMTLHISRNGRWEIKQFNIASDQSYQRSEAKIRNNTNLGMLSRISLIATMKQPKKNEVFLLEFC